MEVDGDTEPEDDEAEASGDEGDGDDVDDTMSVDGTPVPKKVKKKIAKLAPRKSQLNLEALTQEQNALASLDMKHVDALRAQAKYCKDAIIFIDTVEGAMDLMCRLLGSSNKGEVLEVMEFLRVASEYDFFTAKVQFLFVHEWNDANVTYRRELRRCCISSGRRRTPITRQPTQKTRTTCLTRAFAGVFWRCIANSTSKPLKVFLRRTM